MFITLKKRRTSEYIAPINNDVRETQPINKEYRENLIKLENFVLVKGLRDITVLPHDTSCYG